VQKREAALVTAAPKRPVPGKSHLVPVARVREAADQVPRPRAITVVERLLHSRNVEVERVDWALGVGQAQQLVIVQRDVQTCSSCHMLQGGSHGKMLALSYCTPVRQCRSVDARSDKRREQETEQQRNGQYLVQHQSQDGSTIAACFKLPRFGFCPL